MTTNATAWIDSNPPAPGDYVASYSDTLDARMRRRWSGRVWSAPYWHDDPADIAERARATVGEQLTDIVWQPLQ